MASEHKLLLQLQEIDSRVAELEKEVAALPKHLAQIEFTLEAHIRRLEADRAALAANQRDRKKLEGDVQAQEQKISKLKDQMMDAKTNEQYRAFQHEIEYCQKEIRKAEDRILDLMGESDPLEKNVKAAEESLKKEKAAVEAEKKEVQERTAADRDEIQRLQSERKQAAAALDAHLCAAYERIRRKYRNGIAIAEAADGRCTACQIALRPQFFQDLRHDDKVMFCESCGRILY